MSNIKQRGDTLVEVLVAIAVMTSVTVGVLSILNRGIGQVQDAGERTSVRAIVSEQIELLNYFRDVYSQTVAQGGNTGVYPAAVWRDIASRAASGNPITDPGLCSVGASGSEAFYLVYNATTAQYEVQPLDANKEIAAALPSPNNGFWIDSKEYRPGGTSVPYIDFTVKACWNPIAGGVTQNLSSAVRLYDR